MAKKIGSIPISACQIVASETSIAPKSSVEWQIDSPTHSKILLGPSFLDNRIPSLYAARLAQMVIFFEAMHSSGRLKPGTLFVNLGDGPVVRGLAYSSRNPGDVLIPDPSFIDTLGYQKWRDYWADGFVPWPERIPVVFWRGSPTGVWPGKDWYRSPRLVMCRIAATRPDLFDVGVSRFTNRFSEEAKERCRSEGLVRAYIPDHALAFFQYHIDIDGASNAWRSLFLKLLSGSPVMKVESAWGFRQWYYDRLVPWVNYVPVRSDLTDFIEEADWIKTHDEEARKIGQAGRELAMSMDYDTELLGAVDHIAEAVGLSILP